MNDSNKSSGTAISNAPLLTAGNLQVRMTTLHDRHGHAIEANIHGTPVTLLESLEGDASQAWPPSPALQSLNITELDSGPVALLVGMAGRNHWSASYEARTSEGAMVLDWACRTTGEPGQLWTTYRLGETVQLELTADGTSGELVCGSSRWPIMALHGWMSFHDGQLSIVPEAPKERQSPRWAIRVG